jgi:hypothetical protein
MKLARALSYVWKNMKNPSAPDKLFSILKEIAINGRLPYDCIPLDKRDNDGELSYRYVVNIGHLTMDIYVEPDWSVPGVGLIQEMPLIATASVTFNQQYVNYTVEPYTGVFSDDHNTSMQFIVKVYRTLFPKHSNRIHVVKQAGKVKHFWHINDMRKPVERFLPVVKSGNHYSVSFNLNLCRHLAIPLPKPQTSDEDFETQLTQAINPLCVSVQWYHVVVSNVAVRGCVLRLQHDELLHIQLP